MDLWGCRRRLSRRPVIPATLVCVSAQQHFDDAELALVIRGGFRESYHRGVAVAVAPDGSTVAALGNPDTPILPRSTLKPFQAMSSLRAGARLTPEQLAIAAGSHAGTAEHTAVVRSTLEAAGLGEEDLGCPPALPADPAAHDPAATDGPAPRRIWHNCSGKHAAMLAACAASGWDTATYLQPHHPYQEEVRAQLTHSLGPIRATTTDGCGAPIHAVSLRHLAAGYARLLWQDPEGVEVAAAMTAHPLLVGGATADDTRLMQLLPGLVAKRGAEGVFAASAPGRGAVVVKVSDGSMRPAVMVALRLLTLLGVDTGPASALGHTAVLGGGLPVGSVEPSLELLATVQGE